MLTLTVILVLILGILGSWFYWKVQTKYRFWEERGVVTPPPTFLFGNILQMFAQNRADLDLEWSAKYGPVYGFYTGVLPQLMVTDPKLIKQILIKDFAHFVNRQKLNFYHEMWNENLFNAEGEQWRTLRAICSPAFTSGKLRGMHRLMEACITKLEAYLDSIIEKNEGILVDTKKTIAGFTVDVIASTTFATETDSNGDGAEGSPFVAAGKELFDISLLRIFIAFACPRWAIKLCQLRTFFTPKPFNFFLDLTRAIVRQRKSSGIVRADIVQLLLEAAVDEAELARLGFSEMEAKLDTASDKANPSTGSSKLSTKKSLTENEIIAQCFLFFVAGFETSAATIGHLIYELAKHPEIQEKLSQEVAQVVAELGANSEAYFEAVLNGMPYLEATIKEILRLYPPLAVLLRRVGTDGYKLAGIDLPRDTMLEISNYAVHLNPAYYSEPTVFRPERFLPENRHTLVPYTYLPFGQGPRNCVGMRFAYMEIKLLFARLLVKYSFAVTPETPAKLPFKKGAPMLMTQTFPIQISQR